MHPNGGEGAVGRRGALALATTALLLTGCEAERVDSPSDPGPPPTATLGFTQLLPLEGTRHALLRVTNTSDSAMDVTGVAIEWPGYPEGTPSPASAAIAAGQTLDMRVELPNPDCDLAVPGAVVGVVESDQGTVRQELEASGTTYVRRLWRTQCEDVVVRTAVAISSSTSWRIVGSGVDARALGDLVLRRREGDESIQVGGADGSVLHGLRLPGPTTLPAGEDVARIPLEITPGNRCDEHARGQATAPFDFLMRLRIGDRPDIAYRLEVPLTAMKAATEALDVACAARAG